MTSPAALRRTVCPDCRGVVMVPDRVRRLTLDDVLAAHRPTCPAPPARREPRKKGEST